ncbi:MAG: hypothetical protein CMI54_02755 [Parcubacteria group bacterium]|nr:hypothetical protein [Parcubacteria group bacterium]
MTGKSVTLKGGVKEIMVDAEKAGKLVMICQALDREVTGLDGKRASLLGMVSYGVFGPTMETVKRQLA